MYSRRVYVCVCVLFVIIRISNVAASCASGSEGGRDLGRDWHSYESFVGPAVPERLRNTGLVCTTLNGWVSSE